MSGDFLAAGEGFEPSQTESESVVLPLHNPAICLLCRPVICSLCRSTNVIIAEDRKLSIEFFYFFTYKSKKERWSCLAFYLKVRYTTF